jgi:predicted ArsR family transcriptional regulator
MSHATMLETLDTGAVWSVARGLARNVQAYKSHLAACDATRRNDLDGQRVAKILADEGYMAAWEETDGSVRLTEHNCAIRAVAERFPEICDLEERFLRDVLAAGVERHRHILAGCQACEYSIHFPERGPDGDSAPLGSSRSGEQ